MRRQPSDPPPTCERHPDSYLFVDQCGFCRAEERNVSDMEWLAAIRTQDEKCDQHVAGVLYGVDYPEEAQECAGCAPLRALLKRAMAAKSSAPRPPRES